MKSVQNLKRGWNDYRIRWRNAPQFIDKAKRYSEITELTPELLRLFIEKIVVGERAEKYSRTAEQCIWIYYRDIGLMDSVDERDHRVDTRSTEHVVLTA